MMYTAVSNVILTTRVNYSLLTVNRDYKELTSSRLGHNIMWLVLYCKIKIRFCFDRHLQMNTTLFIAYIFLWYQSRAQQQNLEVNEDVAGRNENGLTGQRKTQRNCFVEIGGRMSKI